MSPLFLRGFCLEFKKALCYTKQVKTYFGRNKGFLREMLLDKTKNYKYNEGNNMAKKDLAGKKLEDYPD